MKFSFPAIALGCMLLAVSCDKTDTKEQSQSVEHLQFAPITADTAVLPAPPFREGERAGGGEPKQVNGEAVTWDKMIIKNGHLRVEIKDYRKYNNAIHDVIKKWGAYIASEKEEKDEYKIENTLLIKIPVQHFDDAVQHLSMHEGKVVSKHIVAEDITDEYLDTRARMEAKKRIRLRYLDMLKQAKNMEEILQVEREINAIQEQIEAGEGRMNYLGRAARYSTINLSFYEILNPSAGSGVDPSFADRLVDALKTGARWMSDLLIVALTLWPFWLGAAFAVWFLRRMSRSRVRVAK